MQPEEVLELVGSAPERYDAVRAALRYRADGLKRKEIGERIVRTEAGRRAFQISAREVSEAISWPDGPCGWRSLAWHAGRYHWRVETGASCGGVGISASNGRGRLPIGGPPGSGLVWDRRPPVPDAIRSVFVLCGFCTVAKSCASHSRLAEPGHGLRRHPMRSPRHRSPTGSVIRGTRRRERSGRHPRRSRSWSFAAP